MCVSGGQKLSTRHGHFLMINAGSYSMNSYCIPRGLRSLTKWQVLLQCWESIMLTDSNECTSGKQSCTLGDFIHLHIDDIRTVFAMQKRNTAKIMCLKMTYKNTFDLLLVPLYLTHTHTHRLNLTGLCSVSGVWSHSQLAGKARSSGSTPKRPL